jgi:hypothetical protein
MRVALCVITFIKCLGIAMAVSQTFLPFTPSIPAKNIS